MMQARGGDTSPPKAPAHHTAPVAVRGYTGASHPTVEAIQHRAAAAQAAVSHLAAHHAANVVHHIAHTHANGHSAPPVHQQVADFRDAIHHQADPFHGMSPALRQAFAIAMGPDQSGGPGPGMMWNGSQWVPAPQPQNGFQPQNPAPGQPYSPNGNISIDSNGGGNGLIGLLTGLIG